MSHRLLRLVGASAVLASSGATAALAQPPSQGDYDSYQSAPPGYDDQQAQGDGYYDDGNGAPPQGQGGYPPPQGQGGYSPPPPGQGGYPPPPPGQGGQYSQAPSYGGYGGYNGSQTPPPPPPPAPSGYDGSQPPPPPPGYQAGPDVAQQTAQDQQYGAYAQQWAQAYCVKAHADTGTGAVIGGAIGALLGAGVAGRHDRGAGALVGAGVGALGGAAVASGSNSNATSPGCPPGFVVRGGAPAFAYGGADYAYAAPTWYRPWVMYGGVWTYRPYPYHVWYYRHYGWGPRGYYRGPRGYYRRHW